MCVCVLCVKGESVCERKRERLNEREYLRERVREKEGEADME